MISFKHASAWQTMLSDALNTYPDECCGFFFGTEHEGVKKITDCVVVNNAKEGDKRRRFVITAKDYMLAERFADENNLQLLGVYHSHPDHTAIPSEHDRIAAQPFFSYIIISVMQGKEAETKSWILNDEQQFEEESIAD